MSGRLPGFDYRRPLYYMVTLKRVREGSELCRIIGDVACGYRERNPLTKTLEEVIRGFDRTWHCIAPIRCYAIMPDHIHLLIRLRPEEKRVSLPVIVRLLCREMEKAAGGAAAGQTALRLEGAPAGRMPGPRVGAEWRLAAGASARPHFPAGQTALRLRLFEPEWHDWIVMRAGQLAAFRRYIRENAMRHWLRRSHAANFRLSSGVRFLGRIWYAYGNLALLELPVIEPFRCSRKWREGGPEWSAALARASRIGPGGAGISTFMSPCEKACGRAIGRAGGKWIVLSPEGFGPRWHPSAVREPFCADGRMLFLSLYPADSRTPPNAELYARCHEMGNLVVARLSG